jgi:tRNA dimethylallyltransferase
VPFPVQLLSKCWFLAGPTACGKTAVSFRLAERINAEIVALDSMTLYRGLDIGTAKPTLDERSRVNHHLIDILEPEDEFSLADYVAAAEVACLDIVARGRTPLFVGGAGMYLRGLLRGVFAGPPADWVIRQRLEAQAQAGGSTLHQQLQHIDPRSATRLHPNDQRRIIRALEVYELTGQPLSDLQQQGPRPINEWTARVYWLSPPRDWLYHRINVRVEQMFADGLVNEVRHLVGRTKSPGQTARQALGYKEVIDWMEQQPAGNAVAGISPREITQAGSLDPVRQLIQTRTRQFAKRQHTWFRNLQECVPIPFAGTETVDELVNLVIAAASDAGSHQTR